MTDHRHLIGLLGLPNMGPRRLAKLLDHFGSSEAAWRAVEAGGLGAVDLGMADATRRNVLPQWRSAAQNTVVDDTVALHRSCGVDILHPRHPDWPAALVDDPEPPRLLFCRGDRSLFERVAVAVVGTRRCTALGRSVARDLGRDLTAAGVLVISGLALGIDGEAHHGALAGGGPALGVVATGLDVPYPSRHRQLWADVADAGLLVSEVPVGVGPERWRFPARNRIMAALAEVVVVVESPASGGSMRTVESAMERQTDVMAVPGPVRSRASEGTNQLLVDGCGVVRDAADVLAALGAAVPGRSQQLELGAGDTAPVEAPADPDDPVLQAVSWPATSVERLVEVTGLPFAELSLRLTELELAGAIERTPDGYQRYAQ